MSDSQSNESGLRGEERGESQSAEANESALRAEERGESQSTEANESALRAEEGAESNEASGAGCMVRVGWLVASPAAVAVTAAVLVRDDGGSIVGLSIAYWGSVLAMLVLRYVDIVKLDGTTADGEPASRAHLRRYAVGVVSVTAALYVLALVLQR